MRNIFTGVRFLWGLKDGGYRGKLIAWVKRMFKISLQIIKRDENSFQVLYFKVEWKTAAHDSFDP